MRQLITSKFVNWLTWNLKLGTWIVLVVAVNY